MICRGRAKLVDFCSTSNGRVLGRAGRALLSSAMRKRPACHTALRVSSPRRRFLFKLKRFRSNCLGIHNLSHELARIGARVSVPFVCSDHNFNLL